MTGTTVPPWLADAALRAWNIDLDGRTAAGTVLIRQQGPYAFSRATWEINLGCDFNCEHCYWAKSDSRAWPWPIRKSFFS